LDIREGGEGRLMKGGRLEGRGREGRRISLPCLDLKWRERVVS